MTLQNPSFEDGWGTDLLTGNQIPHGWKLAWSSCGVQLKASGDGEGDTEDYVLCSPECVHKLSWQLPPDEQLGGDDALILDGDATYKVFAAQAFRATLAQSFDVAKGATCRITVPVQTHGQLQEDGTPYNIDTGAAYWRVTVNGKSSDWLTFVSNFDDRSWASYSTIFTADTGVVDVFVEFESHTVAGIDFFIDDVKFSTEGGDPISECRGKPRVQYARTYVLLPQDATSEQFQWVGDYSHAQRWTIGFSADDAGIGDLDDREVVAWWFSPDSWESEESLDDFFAEHYPGVEVVHMYSDVTPPPIDPPPIDPPTGGEPENFVPYGCKTSFHGIGDDGITSFQQALMERGASLPTAKAVQDIGWLEHIKLTDDQTRTVARFIDDGQGSGSLEGFDSTKDYTWQAEKRMYELMPLWSPHRDYVDYWEIVNEQDPNSPEGHATIARFFIRAMEIAELWGYQLALFSYSMGVPEPHEWDAIAQTGVFERAAQGGHAISLHEYGEWPRDQISLLTRYRYVYETHILPRGLDIPLFITEAGAHGFDPSEYTDAQMIEQMVAYDREVSKDPYVAGVHLFTVGGFGSWPQYRDRWVELYPQFVDYAVSVKDRANG